MCWRYLFSLISAKSEISDRDRNKVEIIKEHHIFAQELIWVHSDEISWSWRQKQEKCSKPMGFCQERVVYKS